MIETLALMGVVVAGLGVWFAYRQGYAAGRHDGYNAGRLDGVVAPSLAGGPGAVPR